MPILMSVKANWMILMKTKLSTNSLIFHFKSVRLVYIYTQAQLHSWSWNTVEIIIHYCLETS
jgi:hypothetical protein